MKTANKYNLPLDKTKISAIITKQSPAHRKQIREKNIIYDLSNAIDFICNKNEPVKSSLSGEVIYIQDGIEKIHNKYSPPLLYELKENEISGNYIIIKHENNEYSWYSHLKPHCIKVKTGQKIKENETIGYSGQNSWCLEPHLHFMVIQPTSDDNEIIKGFKSLIIQWK